MRELLEESDEEMYDDDEALDPTYRPSVDDPEEIEAEFEEPQEIKIEAEVEEPQEMEIEAAEEPQPSTSRKPRNTHSGKETTMRFYPLIRGICPMTDHLITHHYCN